MVGFFHLGMQANAYPSSDESFVDNVKFLYWEKLASYRGYPETTKKVV